MVRLFTYLVKLPKGIKEMVTPCDDGFTIYIDESLDEYGQIEAFKHAITHIARDDFNKDNIQEIEQEAHNGNTRNDFRA